MNLEKWLNGRMPDAPLAVVFGVAALMSWATSCIADDFQGATHLMPFDEETINYSKQKDTGPVAQIGRAHV